jgi:hypothetical protein
MNEQENKQTNEKKNRNGASESMKEITCHLIESFKGLRNSRHLFAFTRCFAG